MPIPPPPHPHPAQPVPMAHHAISVLPTWGDPAPLPVSVLVAGMTMQVTTMAEVAVVMVREAWPVRRSKRRLERRSERRSERRHVSAVSSPPTAPPRTTLDRQVCRQEGRQEGRQAHIHRIKGGLVGHCCDTKRVNAVVGSVTSSVIRVMPSSRIRASSPVTPGYAQDQASALLLRIDQTDGHLITTAGPEALASIERPVEPVLYSWLRVNNGSCNS